MLIVMYMYSTYKCNSSSLTVDASVNMSIESDGANVDGHSFFGQGPSKSIDCTIIENTANFNVSLTWKLNNVNVPRFSSGQQPGIYQVYENNTQLYINETESDDGVYSCELSIGNTTVISKSFTLITKGMLLLYCQLV